MRSRRVEILAAAVVLFVCGSPVMAVIQYNDGGTYNITTTVNDDVWVDYESPGMGTTLNILDGVSILPDYQVKGWEDSIINISGGSMDDILAYDRSRVAVYAGSINHYLWAYSSSQVAVSGGSMGYLLARDSSQVTVYAGSISSYLSAYDSSEVAVSGGSMGYLYAIDSSQVTVSGGTINSWLSAEDTSEVTVSGGLFGGELRVLDNAVLTILGWDFAVDGTPVGYTELYSIFGGRYWNEPNRQLTGTLLSGDPINTGFRIGNSGKIVLVPEPATLLLLGLGGLALLRKRKLVLS